MQNAIKAYTKELERSQAERLTGEVKATVQVIKGQVVGFQVSTNARPPARETHDAKDHHFG